MWIALGILTVILLVIYFRSKNAVWGGLTIGIIIGLITASVSAFKGKGFDWLIIVRFGIVTTLIGFGAEMLGKITYLISKHQN